MMLQNMMKDITDLMIKVQSSANWFQKIYTIKYNPFTLIHNTLFLLLISLNSFNEMWDNKLKDKLEYPSQSTPQDIVITLTRWGYIATFSIIEFTIKTIIKHEKYEAFKICLDKWKKGEPVSFSKITKTFKNMDKINNEEFKKWDTLREIRNCLVHNNGYSDKNIIYTVNGEEIVTTENSQLFGKLDGFLILIEQITELYSLLLWNLFNPG